MILRPWPAEDAADSADSARSRPRPVHSQVVIRRGRRLDWGALAHGLAVGMPVDAAAREFRCAANRALRKLRQGRRFRARIELELKHAKLQTSRQSRNLADHAVRQLECRTEKLDARICSGGQSGFAVAAGRLRRMAWPTGLPKWPRCGSRRRH